MIAFSFHKLRPGSQSPGRFREKAGTFGGGCQVERDAHGASHEKINTAEKSISQQIEHAFTFLLRVSRRVTRATVRASVKPQRVAGTKPGRNSGSKQSAAVLDVRRMRLADLKPDERNPRNHPDPGTPGWEALKRSLEHDYIDPMGVNSGKRCAKLKNVLWSGHLRLKVLAEMGVEFADVVVKDYTEREHLARLVAANRQAGEDVDVALANLLKSMDGESLLTGMAEDDMAALLKSLEAPGEFAVVDENLPIEHKCPKCGYQWSGKPS